MKDSTDPWVRTPAELEALVVRLKASPALAIDTEADSLHHYREQVCLIQIAAVGGDAWLVDPLALRDLSALAPVLSDGAILKVLHGGDNDITSMRRDFDFSFGSVFDTAIAARLLGDTEVGLQALLKNELGVALDKGSQRDDWSERPLSPRQEAYALADVEHLMALTARMTRRLAEAGRTAWAREEFEALTQLTAGEDRRVGPEAFRRIKGSARLPRRKQAALRALYDWRETRAEAADRPPFKIVAAEKLLALAENPPATVEAVAASLASYSRLRDEAASIFAIIQGALALPDDQLPDRPNESRPQLATAVRRRMEALRAWRDQQAASSNLDPSIVLSQRVIERLATTAPQTLADLASVDGIRQWRVTEWGPALLAACGSVG